jgi:hypothetical protein
MVKTSQETIPHINMKELKPTGHDGLSRARNLNLSVLVSEPCGPHPFWLMSWLSFSFYNYTQNLRICVCHVTWRSSFGPALSIVSHPVTTETPDKISTPTEEKTVCTTNKNRREPRIVQRVLSFNNKISTNYYTNFYQYFRNYFMIEIMTEWLKTVNTKYLPANELLLWHPKSPYSNHTLNVMDIHNMLFEHP